MMHAVIGLTLDGKLAWLLCTAYSILASHFHSSIIMYVLKINDNHKTSISSYTFWVCANF